MYLIASNIWLRLLVCQWMGKGRRYLVRFGRWHLYCMPMDVVG